MTQISIRWSAQRAFLQFRSSIGALLLLMATQASAQAVPALDATYVSQAVPATMTKSQGYVVSVSMKNTGSETWQAGSVYKLGSQNPQDNSTWGTGRAVLPASVASGQVVTFSVTIKAPATPGTYNFQWKMLKEGVTWFGASTPNIAISVVNTVSNPPPTVSLTAPAAGSSLAAPASVALAATASDTGGSIAFVRFASNGVTVGTDYSAPYSLPLSDLPGGSYSFTAMAVDNGSAATTSAPVAFTVTTSAASSSTATRTYVYDANQRLCKTINPESGATLTDYDADGKVAWIAEGTTLTSPVCDRANAPDSTRTYRSYDRLDRLVLVSTPGGVANVATTYEPDGQVRTLTAANPGGANVTTSYTYNKRRLLTGESSANGVSILSLGYGYDANGFQYSLTYPDNQTVVYSPDALGRATEVRAAAGTTYASNITYYPGGAIKSFTYGNSATHLMLQNLRRLPARSTDLAGSTKVIDDSYAFDQNGNVTDITDQAQNGLTTRGMAYDALDRLTIAVSPAQWGNATWTYDALDNIRSADQGARQFRYSYDGFNRLASIKNPAGALQYSFAYDPRGNTIAKNSQALVFDGANRLNQVTGLQTYRYDGLGRRVQTTDNDGKTTFWIYSQAGQVSYTSEARRSQNLAYIYLGNTQVATRTTAWGSGTVAVRYQHTDSLGSPVAETGPTGAVLKRNSFTAYGEPWAPTSIDGAGYTGHVMDQATGLTYMQQRYYDPKIARFLSNDPMAASTSTGWNFNRDSYAANSPYKFKDPDGRIIDTIADIVFIASDISEISSAGLTATNGIALVADVVGALIPGATGLGAGVKGISHAVEAYRGSKLARNMAEAGRGTKKSIEEAHHIVAQTDKRAAEARAVLERNGIGVHSAENGAAMAKVDHSKVHTSSYHEEVTGRLQTAEQQGADAASRAQSVKCELACMRAELESSGQLNK